MFLQVSTGPVPMEIGPETSRLALEALLPPARCRWDNLRMLFSRTGKPEG